jgi:shikimate dehydrogenase
MSSPDRYAVIGHPVAHSLSPRIHALFARQTQQNLSYAALDVLPDRLESSLSEFFRGGGRGMNVTVPHKEAVVPMLQRLSARAQRAGAVNTIAREADSLLLGDNTDGAGLVRDLTLNLHLTLHGCRILLLGAGGAARGVVGPLVDQRPSELVIANRTPERARALALSWATTGIVRAVAYEAIGAASYDLIINATPAATPAPEIAPVALRPASVCYDMAYGEKESGFMRWARRGGVRDTHDGLGMLVEQAAESFELWRGVRPDTAPVLLALRAQKDAPVREQERGAQ